MLSHLFIRVGNSHPPNYFSSYTPVAVYRLNVAIRRPCLLCSRFSTNVTASAE